MNMKDIPAVIEQDGADIDALSNIVGKDVLPIEGWLILAITLAGKRLDYLNAMKVDPNDAVRELYELATQIVTIIKEERI